MFPASPCRCFFGFYCFLSGSRDHFCFFFFNDTAPPEISPLPLHDALPISSRQGQTRREAGTQSHGSSEALDGRATEGREIEAPREHRGLPHSGGPWCFQAIARPSVASSGRLSSRVSPPCPVCWSPPTPRAACSSRATGTPRPAPRRLP